MPERITRLYPLAHKEYDLAGAISAGIIDREVVYASVRRILMMIKNFE